MEYLVEIFNANGTAATGDFQIHQATAGNQDQVDVIATRGRWLCRFVPFRSRRDRIRSMGGTSIPAVIANGNEYVISNSSNHTQLFPTKIQINNGQIVHAWHNRTSGDIHLQHTDYAGGTIGTLKTIDVSTNYNAWPFVKGLPDGRMFATWTSNLADGSSVGVYGQFLTSSGTPIGSPFVVYATTESAQQVRGLDVLENGNIVVTMDA